MRSPALRLVRSITIFCLLTAGLACAATGEAVKAKKSAIDTAIGKECISCHRDDNPGLVSEWKKSEHSRKNVDCYDCHKAQQGEPGAYAHKKYKDQPVFISTVVSPKRCSNCHAKEVEQQQPSHHASAGQILASLDNIMGEVIGGPAAVNAGCLQCHGGTVKLDANNHPTLQTWPDTGIGAVER